MHNSADDIQIFPQSEKENTSSTEISIIQTPTYDPIVPNDTTTIQTESEKDSYTFQSQFTSELESVNVNVISLDDLSSKVSNRLEILKSLYKKTNDEKVLKVLIDELLANYQFNEVRNYMADIDIFSSSVIDKQSYIYTYINTLVITDPNSMKNFINFIEQMKAKNLISSDEYLFYK
jgi:hypothetical protein